MVKKKFNNERKIQKELFRILLFLVGLIVVFLIASAYFKSLNSFKYDGMSFQKKRIGEIPLYYQNYYFQAPGGKIINYNMYLRGDPRYNNATVVGESSKLISPGAVAYLSINTEGLAECKYSTLAVASISSFMADHQMKVIAGNLDFWQAGARRDKWITCENKPGNIVVEILKGNETKITINNKCYRIEVNNCEILDAVEKLQTKSAADARRASI